MPFRKLINVNISVTWEFMHQPKIEKQFTNQTIRFQPGEIETSVGVDRHTSYAGGLHTVEWLNGKEADVKKATKVLITGADGALIVSGELSWNYPPKEMTAGVKFWIHQKV